MEEPKQIIVLRKDLNMRKGKMCAQAAHASLAVILNYAKRDMQNGTVALYFPSEGPMAEWLFHGRFKKICVYVENEKELDMLYESAFMANLPSVMITDNGLTEFNGVPTKTCIAIGPDYPSKIDLITKHLPLL